MNILEMITTNTFFIDFINYILLILPLILLIFNRKYLYCLYVISIVSNLPLIFTNYFQFSYELYLCGFIVLAIIKELLLNRKIKLILNKETLILSIIIGILLFTHLAISLFNFNQEPFLETVIIYLSNIFLLSIFLYFIKNSVDKNLVIKSIVIGGVIVGISIWYELYINYYVLGYTHGRYGGLIIDPNGASLVLNLAFLISFYKERYFRSFNLVLRIIFRIIIFSSIILTASRSGLISLIFISLFLLAYYLVNQKEAYKAYCFVIVLTVGIFVFRNYVTSFVIELMQMIDLKRISSILLPPSPPQNPTEDIPPVIIDPTSGRWQLMINSIYALKNNLLIGVGIGNVPGVIDSQKLMNSHNLWLQLGLESGILMVINFFVFGIYLIKYLLQKQFKNKEIFILLFIVLFIESFFNHNMIRLNLIWLVLALVMASHIQSSKRKIIIELTYPFKLSKANKELITTDLLENKEYDLQFSIITSTYNRATFLVDLYESLISQTNQSFEWIIINDGSTDNTIDVVNSLKFDNRLLITLINQDHYGKHRALNKGIQLARGKYCLIVDSDDYLTNSALEILSLKFQDVAKKNNFICGVAGLKGDTDKNKIGRFPRLKNEIIANNLERERLKLQGDKAECFYTDIIKQYPFYVFGDETFLTERIVWDEIASDGYLTYYFRDVIYLCRYQKDGLTNQGGKKFIDNPLGYSYFIYNVIRFDFPLFKRIYHLGSYVNNMISNYEVSIKDLAQACEGNMFELLIYSKIHKLLKRMRRKEDVKVGK